MDIFLLYIGLLKNEGAYKVLICTEMCSTSNISQKFSFVRGSLKSFLKFIFISVMFSFLYDQFCSLNKTTRSKYSYFHSRYANQLAFSFLLSSSQDQHLHNFFQYCQKTESGAQALGNELVKYLKVLMAFLETPF